MVTREHILAEIRRLAKENGGRTPGSTVFARETGIREHEWRGVHWARWGDAVKEAGLEPNTKQGKAEEQNILTKLAVACRYFGKFPTAMELRMYRRQDPQFPSYKIFARHFGSMDGTAARLAQWAKGSGGYEDVVATLGEPPVAPLPTSRPAEGAVYLIKSGAHYKIGRSDELERRVKQIRVALPESASLVHSIRTDDPAGIEAYWHRRFADRRANGEWFKLAPSDVAAFKRRKYQ